MTVPGKFDVSATGAAIYTIPIAVPPGTAGMAPALTLDYSSQSGDGMVGLGWSLGGLPTIARCPQTVAQDNAHIGVHYNDRDRFCLEGQRLVRISASEYRTEVEGFSKILAYGGSAVAGPDYFKVWTKAGQIMEFGNTPDSRVLAVGNADHAVRLWAVNKISDSVGNYLTVTYNAAGDTERTADGQLYPVRIDYTGNDNPPTMHTYNHIDFKYLHGRGDVVPRYEAGSLQRNTVLLTDIQTFLGESTLVADYHLDYTPPGTPLRHSELTAVKLCDSAAQTNCLAATKFEWQGTHGAVSLKPSVTPNFNTAQATTGDFNGDGLTDALAPRSCGAYTGQPDGSFILSTIAAVYSYWYRDPDDPNHRWFLVNGNMCFGDALPPVQPVDLDGDAFSDLSFKMTQVRDPGRYYLFNNRTGTLSGGLAASQILPGGWQFADFDGDGRSDLLMGGDGSFSGHFYYSLGNGDFRDSGPVTGLSALYMSRVPADFDGDGCADVLTQGYQVHAKIVFTCPLDTPSVDAPNWFGDPSDSYAIGFGDFNGDGKTDVQRSEEHHPEAVFLSTGAKLPFSPNWDVSSDPDEVDPNFSLFSVYPGDFNGDGRTDLLLVADGINSGGVVHHSIGWNGEAGEIWLSKGLGFHRALTIPYRRDNGQDDHGGMSPGIVPIIADWDSDGAADILLTKTSGDQLYIVNYAPDLLKSVSNGIGSTTTITYDRLNRNGAVYSKCATAGTFNCGHTWPVQDVDGPLYVVTKVEASDGIGGLYASTYSYGQGTIDLKGRGFQGFATRTVTDKLGLVQTTHYGTAFPFLGLVTSESKTCPAALCGTERVLSATTNTYEDVVLGTGTDGVQRHFAALKQTLTSASDLDGAALPTVTTDYTYDCDSSQTCYGNALRVVQTTALAADISTKTTVNTFDNDTTHWFLGRLRNATVTSVADNSTIVRESAYDYDPATGLLKTETIEPNNTTCNGGTTACALATAYSYDVYGNRIGAATTGLAAAMRADGTQVLSARTRATLSAYDDGNHRFPTAVTNALSQSESWQYSPKFGLAANHTGPNGQTTTWSYDAFGRKTREHRPDGTETQLAYAVCAGGCPANGAFQVTATPTANAAGAQIGPKTITTYDALYRVIATDVQGFGGRWIRQQTDYDAYGRVLRTSRPFFVSGGTVYWTTSTTFDRLGRATLVTRPDASTTGFVFHGLTTSVTETIVGGSVASETTTTLRNVRGLAVTVTNAALKSTRYTYDALGAVLTVTDPAGNVTTNTYDVRGNKIASSDPDMGTWHYSYDAFGALYQQTDAKGQLTTLSYDALGRAIKRVEMDQVSQWVYGTDAALFNVGKLILACTGGGVGCTGTTGTSRIMAYDNRGRPKTVNFTVGTTSHGTYAQSYDAPTGRVATLQYPSGLKLQYQYDATLGYLTGIVDYTTPTKRYYGIDARDAEMHLVQSTAGNGVVAIQNFDPKTGLVAQIRASADGTDDGSLAHYDYGFDSNGTLTRRSDWLPGGAGAYSESFCYDALNRLTAAAVGALGSADCHHARAGAMAQSATYDDLGNITSKSDVGAYTYGGSHPHAVMQITGSVLGNTNPKYTYDADGNLTCVFVGGICGADTSIRETTQWTAANRVRQIKQATFALGFDYDSEHQRLVQHEADGSTLIDTVYLNDPMSGALSEKTISGGVTTWRDYLVVDGRIVAQRVKTGASEVWNHFILDHLGSIAIITGEHGAILARQSYDPWGRMRNADGSPDTVCGLPDASQSTRGFTGQEQMARVCLVNLNARIYDPTLGRFLSPDSVTQDLYNLQVLNRYSYCGNNPLSFTDPSGNIFGVDDLIVAAVVLTVAASALHIPVLGDIAVIAASIACGPAGPLCAGASSAAQAGMNGGHIGDILSAFALTAAQAGMMQGIGGMHMSLPGRALMAGMVGGMFSAAQGGNFGSGFLAAGVSMLAAPTVGTIAHGNVLAGTLISAVIGGGASVLGGGKFMNGAVTGAFAYAAGEYAEDKNSLARSNDLLDGPEIPLAERQKIVGDAIAKFHSQPGSSPLSIIINAADTYEIANQTGIYFDHYDTLAEMKAGIIAHEQQSGELWGVVSGWSNGLMSIIYASAAYPQSELYGLKINPETSTLFIVWHENGHQGWPFGGMCLGGQETCANRWAQDHVNGRVGH